MPGASAVPRTLFFLLYILFPGYLTLQSFYKSRISLDDLNRIDKLATVVLGGFLSLVTVAVVYRIDVFSLVSALLYHTLNFLSKFTQNPINQQTLNIPRPSWIVHVSSEILLNRYMTVPHYSFNNGISVSIVTNYSILGSAWFILLQSVFGSFFGFTYGRYRRRLLGNPQSRQELAQPWEQIYKMANVGERIAIIDGDGEIIEGEIQQMGSPSEDHDILLSDPEELIRNMGNRRAYRKSRGKFSYHSWNDISRIELLDPANSIFDPEAETRGDNSFKDEMKTRISTVCNMTRDSVNRALNKEEEPEDEDTREEREFRIDD